MAVTRTAIKNEFPISSVNGDNPTMTEQILKNEFGQSRVTEQDLCRTVGRAIGSAGYPSLSGITVTATGGVVRLIGCVPTYYMKQLAQSITLSVDGVAELRNEIIVT